MAAANAAASSSARAVLTTLPPARSGRVTAAATGGSARTASFCGASSRGVLSALSGRSLTDSSRPLPGKDAESG
jgi:hypothetical protein